MDEDKEIKEKQLADFNERRGQAMAMGGPEQVERQKKRGKLNARERIDKLLDKGTFREIGLFAP